jgi:Family of unknown function (DUF6338)
VSWASSEVVSILWFLLPGFVATWVYAGLTAYPKPSEFERVVQALIFTALTQPTVYVIQAVLIAAGTMFPHPPEWNDASARIWSVAVALGLGLLIAHWANHDTIHRILRKWKITRQTGYPSEWFGVFKDHGRTFIVLHLDGGRRLYGWPEEWPLESRRGHFSMAEASWLNEDNSETVLKGVGRILVPATEVVFVELMEATSADNNQSDGRA